jgi:hypothetical protein
MGHGEGVREIGLSPKTIRKLFSAFLIPISLPGMDIKKTDTHGKILYM